MRKLIALILIWSQVSYAGLPPTSVQGQSDSSPKTKFNFQAPFNQVTDLGGVKSLIETGNSNILPDPGFESITSGWTSSGGATATANSTAKGTGSLGYDWDSNGAGQTLTSSAVTIPAGLQGKNGMISCNIKTVSGTATHTIGLWDGTNLSSTQTITSSTTSFADTKVNLIFPSSGTAAIRLTSVNANEPEVYIDDCKISLADNIGSVSQAILIGQVTFSGCAAAWNTTSTTFADFAAQTGCTYTAYGSASAPATNIPAIKFSSLPAGVYSLEYEGTLGNTVNGITSGFQFWDGTNTAREQSAVSVQASNGFYNGVKQTIEYTTPQSNITISLRGKTDPTGTTRVYGSGTEKRTIRVYYFPSSSQQVLNAQTTANSWSGYHDSTCSFARTNAALGDPTADATCGFAERSNSNFGTVTSYLSGSDKLPGIVFTPTKTQKYYVCATPILSSAISGTNVNLQLIDGSSTVISTSTSTIAVANAERPFQLCGIYNATSTTSKTLKVQFSTGSGAGTIVATGGISNAVEWSIFAIDQSFPAPILIGSVTSNTSGSERIERVNFTCSASSTINSQSSSWLTSIGNVSSGKCVINFNGTPFSSSNYSCTFGVTGSATTTAIYVGKLSNKTTSGFDFIQLGQSGGTTTTDSANTYDAICIGPR
jgi:hypothetical protein